MPLPFHSPTGENLRVVKLTVTPVRPPNVIGNRDPALAAAQPWPWDAG